MNQSLDGIERIQTFVPKVLIVPGIFTDGEGHLLATKRKQQLAFSRRKVAHLIEDIVGGQQHLGLQERHSAVFEQRGGVHHRLAALRVGGSHQPADDGDAAGFARNAVRTLAVVLNERGALHQVTRRVTAYREFREKDQSCAIGLGATGKFNDFRARCLRNPPLWD